MSRHRTLMIVGVSAALIVAAACGGASKEDEPKPLDPEMETDPLAIARAEFPSGLVFHQKVIARTCSPNPGVCHQSANYPDLRTPGSLLAARLADCNVEIPDPEQGWDGCERDADVVRYSDVANPIAWVEPAAGGMRIELRSPATFTGSTAFTIMSAAGESVLDAALIPEWEVAIHLEAGKTSALVTSSTVGFVADFVNSVLEGVVEGDPNRNGAYGAEGETRGALITPGSLERSYLWGRITGTVPGSRMPLANQALSNAEYLALACFIEGMSADGTDAAEKAIDYDACEFAKNPTPYAIGAPE